MYLCLWVRMMHMYLYTYSIIQLQCVYIKSYHIPLGISHQISHPILSNLFHHPPSPVHRLVPLRLQHRRRPRRRRRHRPQAQRRPGAVEVLDARHGEAPGGEVLQEPTEVDALGAGMMGK